MLAACIVILFTLVGVPLFLIFLPGLVAFGAGAFALAVIKLTGIIK